MCSFVDRQLSVLKCFVAVAVAVAVSFSLSLFAASLLLLLSHVDLSLFGILIRDWWVR